MEARDADLQLVQMTVEKFVFDSFHTKESSVFCCFFLISFRTCLNLKMFSIDGSIVKFKKKNSKFYLIALEMIDLIC